MRSVRRPDRILARAVDVEARTEPVAAPLPRVAAHVVQPEAVWLERIGGRAATTLDLTPTEQQIADLIASGLSYRETADALFISPKTVQWNLSKVYSKLGIRSRAELPGRLKED